MQEFKALGVFLPLAFIWFSTLLFSILRINIWSVLRINTWSFPLSFFIDLGISWGSFLFLFMEAMIFGYVIFEENENIRRKEVII